MKHAIGRIIKWDDEKKLATVSWGLHKIWQYWFWMVVSFCLGVIFALYFTHPISSLGLIIPPDIQVGLWPQK